MNDSHIHPFWSGLSACDQRMLLIGKCPIDEKRNVTGRVVFDAAAGGSLEDVEIHIVSIDDNYEEEQSLKCKGRDSFSFDTLAAEVGIFACTEDRKAAGSIITKDLASPIELHLHPTTAYHGQLLATGNQPAVSHPVQAYVRLQGKRVAGSLFPKSFEVDRIETKTDKQGNFTLHGIPSQMRATIWADAIDGSEDAVYVGEVYLEPNESRPRTVSHMANSAAAEGKVPLAE